jgi:hypothetical protein
MSSNLNLTQVNLMKKVEFLDKDIKKLYETIAYLDDKILKVHRLVLDKLAKIPELTQSEIECAQNYNDN